jgi:hypothetical protein
MATRQQCWPYEFIIFALHEYGRADKVQMDRTGGTPSDACTSPSRGPPASSGHLRGAAIQRMAGADLTMLKVKSRHQLKQHLLYPAHGADPRGSAPLTRPIALRRTTGDGIRDTSARWPRPSGGLRVV